jgi:hypothetical protein
MKHIKTFENFEYKPDDIIVDSTIEDDKIDEGFMDSLGKSDFMKGLTNLYSRENITITKEINNLVFEKVVALKKEGKATQVIANGLNRAKRGIFLNIKIGDFNDLYYNAEAKGHGAGLV